MENRTAFPVQAAFSQAFSSTVHCICIVQVFIQLVHAVFFVLLIQMGIYLQSGLDVGVSHLIARGKHTDPEETEASVQNVCRSW